MDDAGGDTHGHGVGRDSANRDGICAHGRTGLDNCSFEYRRAPAYPGILADTHRRVTERAAAQ